MRSPRNRGGCVEDPGSSPGGKQKRRRIADGRETELASGDAGSFREREIKHGAVVGENSREENGERYPRVGSGQSGLSASCLRNRCPPSALVVALRRPLWTVSLSQAPPDPLGLTSYFSPIAAAVALTSRALTSFLHRGPDSTFPRAYTEGLSLAAWGLLTPQPATSKELLSCSTLKGGWAPWPAGEALDPHGTGARVPVRFPCSLQTGDSGTRFRCE